MIDTKRLSRIKGVAVCPSCGHPVFDTSYVRPKRNGNVGCECCANLFGAVLASKRKKNLMLFFKRKENAKNANIK